MKLSDIYTRHVVTAEPDESLATVARKMDEHNVGTVVVLDDGRPVGIITDRDVALALGARRLGSDTPVEKVMSRHVLAVPEDASVFSATRYIRECGVRRLPIVDREDRVVGMVSMDDLLRTFAEELHNLAMGIEPEMAVR
ncbi:MAG: CBS domain-containing protein [Gemmataceae bacterium]